MSQKYCFKNHRRTAKQTKVFVETIQHLSPVQTGKTLPQWVMLPEGITSCLSLLVLLWLLLLAAEAQSLAFHLWPFKCSWNQIARSCLLFSKHLLLLLMSFKLPIFSNVSVDEGNGSRDTPINFPIRKDQIYSEALAQFRLGGSLQAFNIPTPGSAPDLPGWARFLAIWSQMISINNNYYDL